MTVRTSTVDRQRAAAYVRLVLRVPYVEGGNDMNGFSCWGLTRHCQRTLFGRELPIASNPHDILTVLAVLDDPEVKDCWPEAQRPEHGALVALKSTLERHIGVYLDVDGGAVLHTLERCGTQFQTLMLLGQTGWGRPRFHVFRERAA